MDGKAAAGAAVGAATSSQVRQDDVSRPTSPGSWRGQTAVVGEKWGSGVLLPGQLALGPAPMDGAMAFPQQQRSEDEDEEKGGALLRAFAGASRDAGTAATAAASAPKDTTFNEEELSAAAPAPTASWRRRSMLCGRTTLAALKLVWSTATTTATLVAALLAALVFLWALAPVCTSCVRRRSNNSPAFAGESGRSSTYSNQLQVSQRGRSTMYINQLQVIGTHNSYHQRTYVPATSRFWDFNYPSLTAQLDAGIRHLELDIHYDWKTGRWFVFHLSVLDPMSSCSCLSACLEEIREWSDAHPAHHILFIELELKLLTDFLQLCGQKTPDADHAAFRAMQETVVAEFPPGRILTPRQVRGDYETLTEAINTASNFEKYSSSSSFSEEEEEEGGGVGRDGSGSSGGTEQELKGGWPLVDDSRGKVLFILDYLSTNLPCRPAIRKALPDDDTVFFERTPLGEAHNTSLLAFLETGISGPIEQWARAGVIVRDRIRDRIWNSKSASEHDEGEDRPTYIVHTAAQLVVWDDLRAVERSSKITTQGGDKGVLASPLPCLSRCSAIVPEEQCVLEGFC